MEMHWFIYERGEVKGPLSTNDIQNGVSESLWDSEAKIWWKGQKEWMSLTSWTTRANDIIKARSSPPSKPIWYIERLGKQIGPLKKNELVELLKNTPNRKGLRIWSKHMRTWKEIFEVKEITGPLGINHREHPRANLVGEVELYIGKDKYIAHLESISEGGLGVSGINAELEPDQAYHVVVRSPLLVENIATTSQVVYFSNSKAGLKFEALTFEYKSMIIDYVRQFHLDNALLNENNPSEKVEEDINDIFPTADLSTPFPKSENDNSNKLWFFSRGNKTKGPFSDNELLSLLKKQSKYSDIKVWSPGSTDWKSLFEFHEIMEELNLSRRKHPRAPIVGVAKIESKLNPVSLEISTISETGIGTKGSLEQKIGDEVELSIESESFSKPITVKAKLMYLDHQNHAGFLFTDKDLQARVEIQSYLEKFKGLKEATVENSDDKSSAA